MVSDAYIIDVIINNQCLNHLNLSSTRVTDELIYNINDLLVSINSLKTLDIRYCKYIDKAFLSIMKLISKVNTLEHVLYGENFQYHRFD